LQKISVEDIELIFTSIFQEIEKAINLELPFKIDDFLDIKYKYMNFKATSKKEAFTNVIPVSEVLVSETETLVGHDTYIKHKKENIVDVYETEQTFIEFKPHKNLIKRKDAILL